MLKQHESLEDYRDLLSESYDDMMEISSGGGGIIIKAHHKGLDKEVIIKKVIRSKVGTLGKTGERDALKNLKHSCLPQIYDYFENGDDVFTVMEFIPGENFSQILEKGNVKFKQRDLEKWTLQLCDVVNYLHTRKPAIIHCDIKPANIMLTPEGNICLIDFNISGIKNGEDLGTVGYTPGYAPPEQFFLSRTFRKNKIQNNDSPSIISDDFDDSTQIDDEATQIDGDILDNELTLVDDDKTAGGVSDVYNNIIEPANNESENNKEKPALFSQKTSNLESWTNDRIISYIQGNGIKAQIDERTDIYSIGATLFHIATGIKPAPFFDNNPHVQDLNPSLSDGLAYIITKAMCLKPQDRFQDCGTMLKMASQIHRLDKRYKRFGRIEIAIILLCGVMMLAGILISQRGIQLMGDEEDQLYGQLVEELSDLRQDGRYEDMEELYLQAIELAPDRADAYFEKGLALYESRQYEECTEFIRYEVLSNEAVAGLDIRGIFNYLVACSYFELGDYKQAIVFYDKAISVDPSNSSYYRDYVISMARVGDVDGAENGLMKAESAGVKQDVMMLLEGEIYYAESRYSDAIESLKECITLSSDAEVLMRAYVKLDDALCELYTVPEQYELREECLEEAVSRLPSQNRIILMETLAQVYMDHSDAISDSELNGKALEMFFQIRDDGYGTFQTDYNIAVLYEKMSMYEDAQSWSLKMIEDRGEQYRWYKRLAFTELQIQNGLENINRDYGQFLRYYERAMELYNDNSNVTDSEMLVLENLYSDLIDMGWL